jgi:hypothetical protein
LAICRRSARRSNESDAPIFADADGRAARFFPNADQTSQIAGFMRIASKAREGQIARAIETAVFFRDDVLDLKSEEWLVRLP